VIDPVNLSNNLSVAEQKYRKTYHTNLVNLGFLEEQSLSDEEYGEELNEALDNY
jgi:hypothetical protein